MKNLSKKKRIFIISGIIALVAIILIGISCLTKEDAPEKKAGNSPQTELQEDIPDTNETLHFSEEEVQTDTYDDIFGDKPNTTENKSENKSDNKSDDKSDSQSKGESDDKSSDTLDDKPEDDDVTKENLEESEDTSTGYGPIS